MHLDKPFLILVTKQQLINFVMYYVLNQLLNVTPKIINRRPLQELQILLQKSATGLTIMKKTKSIP